jgi:hypothetical protein
MRIRKYFGGTRPIGLTTIKDRALPQRQNRVIVFLSQSYSNFVKKKLSLENLSRNGYNVEIFNLSQLEKNCCNLMNGIETSCNVRMTVITSYKQLIGLLEVQTIPSVVIDFANVNPRARYICNRKAIPIIKLVTGGLPVSNPKPSLGESSTLALSSIKLGGSLDVLLNKILTNYRRVRQRGFSNSVSSMIKKLNELYYTRVKNAHIDVLISGGECLWGNERQYIRQGTKLIFAHVHDYERYKAFDRVKFGKKGETRYLAFLDQDIDNHPDLKILGNTYSSREVYRKKLLSMFDSIENLGYEIVIALHPRDTKEDPKAYFNGRPCYKNDTVALVAGACGVVTHCSNSINYAVLFRIPIIFIADAELKAMFFQIEILSRWLRAKVLDMDSALYPNTVRESMFVDQVAYENYQRSFIKCEKDDGGTLIQEIIHKEIDRAGEKNGY